MPQNPTDHAIVVGIDRYRWDGLPPLGGARADATAFYEWLIDGGGLDPANVTLIEGNDPASTPTAFLIAEAFNGLVERAKKTSSKKRIGRRLYVFMSGHGASHEAQGVNNVGILPATFDDDDATLYVVARQYVETLQTRCAFEEICLFLDCCRDRAPMRLVPMPPAFSGDNEEGDDPAATLIAYATQYAARARERAFTAPTGARIRGIFTMALLEGLHGWAADRTGSVTKASLERYLISRIQYYRPAGSTQRPQVDGDIDTKILPGPFSIRPTRLVIELNEPRPDRVIVKDDDGEETVVEVPPAATQVTLQLKGLERFLISRPDGPKHSINLAGEEMRLGLP